MCSYNEAETLSTLQFGQRAKSIKNKVKANVEKSAKELQRLLDLAMDKISSYEELIKKLGGGCHILPDIQEEEEAEGNDKGTQTESIGIVIEANVEDSVSVQNKEDSLEEIDEQNKSINIKIEETEKLEESPILLKKQASKQIDDESASPKKQFKRKAIVSQALSLINKKHEVKKLKDEISNLSEQLKIKSSTLEETNSKITSLTLELSSERSKNRVFMEGFQGGLEKELEAASERSSKLLFLGKELQELRMQFLFLTNDADLAIMEQNKTNKEGRYAEQFADRLRAIKQGAGESSAKIADLQIRFFSEKSNFEPKFLEGSLKMVNSYLENAQNDMFGDELRMSSFAFDLYDKESTTLEDIDVSKINTKQESANTTLINSDQDVDDKDILEAINQSDELESSKNEYAELLQTQKVSMEALYKQIDKLESEKKILKNQIEEAKDKMLAKLRDVSNKSEASLTALKQSEFQLKSQLQEIKQEKEAQSKHHSHELLERSKQITQLQAEMDRITRAVENNQGARSILELENQIIKLANERQSFFEHRFNLETQINEKEEILQQRELQISMMKDQIKILNKEIEESKRTTKGAFDLVPRNIVKKIRGGGGKEGLYRNAEDQFEESPRKGDGEIIPRIESGKRPMSQRDRYMRSLSKNKSKVIRTNLELSKDDFKPVLVKKQQSEAELKISLRKASEKVLRGLEEYKAGREKGGSNSNRSEAKSTGGLFGKVSGFFGSHKK